jgi:hypothetical protein
MTKYPNAVQQRKAAGRLTLRKVGSAEGIIIATIIASHMSRKLLADANQLSPCIGIHIIDIVQPPGISTSEHIERQK